MRSCEECSLCCKLPGVESDGLSKAMGEWCTHCTISKGCQIYESRPTSCKAFQCLWLMDDKMPDEMRPDKSKVLFYPPEEQPIKGETVDLIMMEDPKQPDRWKSGSVGRLVNSFLHQGLTLCIVSGERYRLLRPREFRISSASR